MKIGGKEINKWWLVGGAGGAVLVFYLYRRSASAASSASSTTTGTDPVTGLPYAEDQQVDPLTGMTYLSEAQEYGSVSAAEQAVSSGYDASGESAYSGTAGSSTGTTSVTSTTGSYATNAAWSQAVTAGLTGLGYSSTDIAAALGLFFAQQPLGNGSDGVSYASIVQAAEAEFGPPPQGTYSIIPEPSTGTGGAGDGGTTVTTGTTAPTAITVAPTGFRVVSVTNGDNVNLAWNAVKGATGYEIAYGPTSGSQAYKQGVGGGNTTEASVPGVGAGAAGKHYFEIWALPANPGGPHAGPIEATTTKS